MSCLFQSLSRFVGSDAATVRSEICDAMAIAHDGDVYAGVSIPEWVQFASDDTREQYIARMRSHSTMGGGVEIAVACYLYRIEARVILNGRCVARFPAPDGSPPNPTVAWLDYNGHHYEPMDGPPAGAMDGPSEGATDAPPAGAEAVAEAEAETGSASA